MAVTTPEVSFTINNEITTGTLTDDTVYGGSNDIRTDVAVYASLTKLTSNLGETDLPLTGDQEDPTLDAEWTWDYLMDGWHQAKLVVISKYDNTTTYNQYDAVYNNGIVYRSKSAAPVTGVQPPNTTYWEAIPDPIDLLDTIDETNESTNIGYKIYNEILYPTSQKEFGDSISNAAEDTCTDCTRAEDVEVYEFLGVMVDAMNLANTRSRFADGEKIARKVTQYIG